MITGTPLMILCLIVFIFLIWLGSSKGRIIGIYAIAAATILVYLAGMKVNSIFSGFDIKLFLRLFGISLLCNVTRQSGTAAIVAQKLTNLGSGAAIKVFPFILFALTWVCTLFGMGVSTVFVVIAITIAKESNQPVIRVILPVLLGLNSATLSELSTHGAVLLSKSEELGLVQNNYNCVGDMTIVAFIILVVVYIVGKWYKVEAAGIGEQKEQLKMQKKNWFNAAGLLLMVALAVIFKFDIGLISTVIAVILMLLGCAEEKAVFAKLPWTTMIMVGGMGMMVAMAKEAGLIDAGVALISKLESPIIVKPLLVLMAGLLSMVSSAQGVVIPSLSELAPGLAETLGVDAVELLYGVCGGAVITSFSPLSTMGGFTMATYMSGIDSSDSEAERAKLFRQLLLTTFLLLLVFMVATALGVFKIRFFAVQ